MKSKEASDHWGNEISFLFWC